MMDILGAIRVGAAALQMGLDLDDCETLYTAYTAVKGGTFSIKDSATLTKEVAALGRVAPIVSSLLQDKTQGPRLLALLASLA
jgi:hypothetical protein